MVRLIEKKNELDFLPADPFAARITALFETYGSGQSFAYFWVQTLDGMPVAAISRVDGNMTLCCEENADYEELAYFINAAGYDSLTCNVSDMQKLGFVHKKESFIVEYTGGEEPSEIKAVCECDKRKIYDLLCECGFELGDYHAFLTDVCARLNKGTASFSAIVENGEPEACAFALFEGDKSVLLGAVATKESARGKGFASALVANLAKEKSCKNVFLFCRNDRLAEVYGKIGFKTVGRWAVSD